MLLDLVSLLLGCITIFHAKEPEVFAMTLLAGVILAGVCWYVCTVYTHYWNRRFQVTLIHHILCGFASICTLIFIVLFVSLFYTKEAALASIEAWQAQLNLDSAWADRTFAMAYDKVKELNIEDFSNTQPPGTPGSLIPTTKDESRQTAASVYANEACRHFDTNRPFLSKIVWSSPGVPSETIVKDTNEWFQSNPVYPVTRAIDIAANQIREGLEPQVPRVLTLARTAVFVLFVLIQAIPFGLIGWAAYTDIKVTV
jgi:hypothetical protein